jgi:hypothetical protein
MLIPDYLAIGTLVILILGAVARVRSKPRLKKYVGTAYVSLSRDPGIVRSRS